MKKPVASWYFFWFIMFYRSANRTNTKFYPFSRPFLKSNSIIVSFSKFIYALALLTNPIQAKGMLHKNIILWSPVGELLRTHNGHYKQDSACNTGTTFRWCSWIYIRIIWVIVVRISINFSSFIYILQTQCKSSSTTFSHLLDNSGCCVQYRSRETSERTFQPVNKDQNTK